MSSPAPDRDEGWDELMSLFRDEAGERAQVLERELLAGSPPEGELLETLSREAHALKGTAAVLGLTELAELAGGIEKGLRSAAGGAGHPPVEVIGRASAAFRAGVDATARGEDSPPSVAAALAELRDSKLSDSDQQNGPVNETGDSHVPPDDPSTGDSASDLPAPDWYPDPWDPDRSLRWWDGAEWTGHTAELGEEEAGEPAAEVTPGEQVAPAEPSHGGEEPTEPVAEAEQIAEPPLEPEEPAEPPVEPEEPLEPVVEAEAPPTEPAERPVEPEEPAEPVPPAPAAKDPEAGEAAQWSPEAQDDATGSPPGWEDRPRVMVHGEQPQATGGVPKEVVMIAAGAVALIVLLLLLLG